jgi:2',3'-cyclic-nucleotide 2'-phosphodiesterase (5'-nucleotidase family)
MKFIRSSLVSVFSFLIIISFFSCSEKTSETPIPDEGQNLTIFFVNDIHGQLNNFAKIKHIVDAEREVTNVLLASAGDIFSGNPIVDQFSEKGYPIIDIMNKTGFDISVLGNHEFDYGLSTLKDRMAQAEFEWVCANVDAQTSVLPQPKPYTTLTVGDLKVTVLGLVETFGKPDDIIPATHPWRVVELSFKYYYNVVTEYMNLKEQEDADLYIALTHLGTYSDNILANDFPYFDVIIGGHSNDLNQKAVNGIPVLMAGKYLSHLGKIELTIVDKEVTSYEIELIDLNNYTEVDQTVMATIEEYNNAPEFDEVIGFANSHHNRDELGCFYTTALKEYMQVDISFQNSGGIRADIDQGEITTLDIFNMDPFNNGSVVFTMTAAEIKNFFILTRAGLHITGVTLEQSGGEIRMFDEAGNEIRDTDVLTIGTNDYIPAVYDAFFSIEDAEIRDLTTAETLIQYLKTMNSTLDYENCDRYFRYN